MFEALVMMEMSAPGTGWDSSVRSAKVFLILAKASVAAGDQWSSALRFYKRECMGWRMSVQ